MIYGHRITELRKKLSLSKQDLAIRVGVSVATITNWENSKSTPTISNLQKLAKVLGTPPAYIEGMTDIASLPPIPAKTEETPPTITQPGLCEDCGNPVPERVRKCPSCRWKTRWPESVLNSPRLASRRKRSHSVHLLSLDREKPEAVFGSSTDKNRTTYITTLETCTCRDFEITRGEIPCKHILRLAGELGFFQSEYFAPGEDDYTLHVASEIPDVDSAEYERKLADMAETPPEIPEPVKYLPAVVPTPKSVPTKPGLFVRLLKYALCCFFGLFGIVPVVVAVEGDKVARCFSVAFVIAGILTAITARRKGENSAFKWWLYGALVPIVSWIDVVMLGAESKAKAFIKGLTFSVFGLFGFMAVLSAFVLPAPPQKPLQTETSVTPVVSIDVAPVSVSSQPAPKVSTDAEISAARAKHEEEMRKASAEYERQQREEERRQKAERKRIEQEYLKKANTVVVTSKGRKYHYSTCRTVKGSYRELTIVQARKKGYTPCKVCEPPAQTVTHANIYWGDNVYTSGKVVLDVD
ncbi:MAG: helix-turn-helix domain-containing protein [Synergistaceae bacterium]|nr:helix-turn-helix domain-containing protein [Synergistaceae bacterium]